MTAERPHAPRAGRRLAATLVIAVLLGHIAAIVIVRDQSARTTLNDILFPLESLAAAVFLVVAGLRGRDLGNRVLIGWLMLGAGYACMAFGDMGWFVLEILERRPPFPSAADIVYLLSYPTYLAGVFLLASPGLKPGERIRRILDIGILMMSAALVLWAFVMGPLRAKGPQESELFGVLAILYPAGDLALISAFLILVFAGPTSVSRGSQLLLIASIIGQIVADALFAFQSFEGVYVSGNPGDIAYIASYGLAMLAALHSRGAAPAETPERDRGGWRERLPFLGILVVFFILLWSRIHPLEISDTVLAVWSGIIIAFSIARQAQQGVENDRLTRALHSSREELDQRVLERTSLLAEANLELALLDRVRTALARETDLSVVLKTIVEAVAGTLGYSMVSLYIREQDVLVLHNEVGYRNLVRRIALNEGVIGRVARTGKPSLVVDSDQDPDFIDLAGVRSEAAVPLLNRGETLGVLNVESPRVGTFDDADVRLLSAVADHAVIAIERARLFALVRDARAELERRVEERTAELEKSQERLRQAEKMEAVGRLAGGVAHDFNNLLTVIIGHAHMLLDDMDLAVKSKKGVSALLESAERAASLTRQLLMFSRRQVMEIKPLNLGAAVEGMADMVSRLIGEHVRLEVRADAAPWSVLADKVQVEQVLLNLAANAAEAMPEGGILSIETSNVFLYDPLPSRPELIPPGRYVLLSVRDTGHGMAAGVQEHAFEPFFTTKKEGTGTGLGLATVYGIVKQTGGFVALDSAPGCGATFCIYLPAVEDKAPEPEKPSSDGQPVGGTETILVVDDRDEVRSITGLMLRKLGYTVYEMTSGQAALEFLCTLTHSVDLIITDVSMPGMTGPTFMRQVASRGLSPPAIFMSGYAREATDESTPDAVFIEKPFTTKKLARAVRNALDGNRREDETHG
ncbi:MAG TPA: GAF domain-containing protein [Spirochaetia bacterium]|nr:GAF domain-containing protein [Spirochaetia bacterium]